MKLCFDMFVYELAQPCEAYIDMLYPLEQICAPWRWEESDLQFLPPKMRRKAPTLHHSVGGLQVFGHRLPAALPR